MTHTSLIIGPVALSFTFWPRLGVPVTVGGIESQEVRGQPKWNSLLILMDESCFKDSRAISNPYLITWPDTN